MKNRMSLVLLLALSFGVGRTSQGQGAIIANTFGPGNSFNQFSGCGISWSVSTAFGNGVAASFSVNGGDYFLDSVTLALGHQFFTSAMTISIVRDNSGNPTGSLVETVTSDLSAVTGLNQVVTFESSLNPIMANGEMFWLVVEPPAQNLSNDDDNSVFSWYASEMIGPVGIRNFNLNTGNWQSWDVFNGSYSPAFSIEGTAVPEPGTVSLLLLGAGFFGFHRWRKFRFKVK